GGAYLQVVDRRGLILVSQTPAEILQPLPQKTSIPMQPEAAIAVVATPSGDEVVVTQPANQGEWWVVVRQPTRAAYAAARSGVRSVVLGAILLFATSLGMVLALAQRLHRTVTEPVRAAGAIASRVAGGDLSVTVATYRTEATQGGFGGAGAPPQRGTRPEHVTSREGRGRSCQGRRRSGSSRTGRGEDPDLRRADESRLDADQHAGPQRGDRGRACRSGGSGV